MTINRLQKGKEVNTMADAAAGKKYKIIKILGGHRLNSRLCAMGLLPGETFRVYAAARGGPLCITVKGSKFAVGRGMVDRVIIRENG